MFRDGGRYVLGLKPPKAKMVAMSLEKRKRGGRLTPRCKILGNRQTRYHLSDITAMGQINTFCLINTNKCTQ